MSTLGNNLLQNLSEKLTAMFSERVRMDFGRNGFDVISDTAAHTGDWYAIKASGSANAVIATGTSKAGDSLSAYTLAASDVIYGPFSAITLTSGTVIAYRRTR